MKIKNTLRLQITHAMHYACRAASILASMAFFVALSGCAGNQDTAGARSNTDSPQGGIDGSGGNVAGTTYPEFLEAVSQQKIVMRDFLHRLNLVASPKNESLNIWREFGILDEVFKKLMGEDHATLQAQLAATEFFGQEGPCIGKDSSATDAAVVDGKICFSYQAFKRFGKWELPRQLAYLSIHEFGHVRGMNEFEASGLQAAIIASPFRGLGKLLIVGSQTYQMFYEGLLSIAAEELISTTIAFAMQVKDEGRIFCGSLQKARGKMQLASVNAGLALPGHLHKKLRVEIIRPLVDLELNCFFAKPEERYDKLVLVFEGLRDFLKALYRYENPICESGICDRSRNNPVYPGAVLNLLEVNKKWLRAGIKPPAGFDEKIDCELLNLETGKMNPVEEYAGRPFWSVRQRTSSTYSLHVEQTILGGAEVPAVRMTLENDRFVAVKLDGIDSSYGDLYSLGFTGYLQRGIREELSAEIAELPENSLFKPSKMDPVYYSVEKIPDLKAKYRVTCRLRPTR